MKQDFKSVTRGGQTFLHSLRMINQILRMVLLSSGVIFILTAISWFMTHTTSYDRYLYRGWLFAKSLYAINPHSTQKIKEQNGELVKVYNYAILNSPSVQAKSAEVHHIMITSLWIGLGTTIPFAMATLIWFSRRGKQIEETELVKGTYVSTADELNKLIRKTGEIGDLVFADIQLYRGAEQQHFLVHGTTGTGKSFLIGKMLTQIRARGNKAIVYDKHGTFIQTFYNPETDIILNPMDARCAPWDIWAECRDESDFDSMATALMPMPPSQSADPFWINAARTIFASLAFRMKNKPERSTKNLLSHLFT
ncbi:MAG: type IV secretion system DNA-binding domain-containing protein, partial [Gammaproteobacteria bacterium]